MNIWSRSFTIEDVKKVDAVFKRGGSYGGVGSNDTGIYVNKIWMGCPSEGTEVTQEDINRIARMYKEVNK